jgi:hypothetical protein
MFKHSYPAGSTDDRELLLNLPEKTLVDLFFMQVRNIFRVDGLYFIALEERFGTKVASEIDRGVWEQMAKREAQTLSALVHQGATPGIPEIIRLLRLSGWALDQPFKTIEVAENHARIRIDRCRTQETRLQKQWGEFPCRDVRLGYLSAFAQTLNPGVEVTCVFCPPDKHPKEAWCAWEFRQK